jgi:hypothetical protein
MAIVAQGTLDGALALIEVLADRDRVKKYLAEIEDAGITAARLEAERHAAGLSRREEAVAAAETAVARLKAEVEPPGVRSFPVGFVWPTSVTVS